MSKFYVFFSCSGLTCLTCGFTFEDLLSQQQHFKTSAHRQNLIRKLHGLTPQHAGDEIGDVDMLTKRFTSSSALVDDPPSDEEDGDSHSDKDEEPEAPSQNISGSIQLYIVYKITSL